MNNEGAQIAVNWLGDVVMPVGVLLISLAVSIGIAVASATAARRAVIFQYDIRYSDEFLAVLEVEQAYRMFDPDQGEAYSRASRVNQARVRFSSRASGNADLFLAAYLSKQEQIVWAAQRRYFDELRLLRSGGMPPVSAALAALDEEDRAETGRALARMQRIARDWPFEDRRRTILERIARSHMLDWHKPPEDPQLAIRRQMLHARPSRIFLVQWAREFTVWVQGWRETVRFGRTRSRVRDWLRGRVETSLSRADMRRQYVAAKAARRETIELRRLQELAGEYYSQMRQEVPFRFVEVPPMPRRSARPRRRPHWNEDLY
ncbi:hypothetical protein QSU92_01290 [Microbacterium sp. ET2]|uniref:hypothetical protein n=1 Tax=Microbacterium albipurpureum TaxID=3050384 RepID=UPI00259CEBFA|nr:hypothetical protein [Microbacterium sp. ET2 (Ac-2212)]WJL95889.1 hypothetical protein QSU92_01290 [Microbacterium sp. ET2 (Ac-2212)]